MVKRKVNHLSLILMFNQKEILMFNFSAARGRPQGSVKKPKQPKATKTKIKIAVKKTKEPKKKTENK